MLIQLLETVSLERPALFYSSLNAVCSSWASSKVKLSTDQEIYDHVTKLVKSEDLLGIKGELESFAFSLSIKEAHPQIEAFRAWYATLPSNLTGTVETGKDSALESHGCESWVLAKDSKICDPAKLSELLDSDDVSDWTSSSSQTLPFDHQQGQEAETSPIPAVILYASADPGSFCPLHQLLDSASKPRSPKISYIFRWKIPSALPASSQPQPNSFLSGWGASLDIKKSEYLTLDDRPVESDSSNDAQLVMDGKDLPNKKESPVDSEQAKLKPLKAAEIFDIGSKATQHVLSSSSPLTTLRHLTENFPLYAHALVNEWVPGKIPKDLRLELKQNMADGYPPGQSEVWMNGLPLSSLVSLENLNMFKLIEIMRTERRWIGCLTDLGLSPLQARELIVDETLIQAMNPEASVNPNEMEITASSLGERFDASDREESGEAIIWLNDLENDAKYSSWPTTLRAILRPTFPGQLHAIAQNLINVVLGLDLTRTHNLRTLGHVVEPFISRGLPIRWGVVPIAPKNSSEEELMSRCFWNLTESVGPIEALKFIREFTQDLESDRIEVETFVAQAREHIISHSQDDILPKTENVETWLKQSRLYSSRLSLCSSDQSLSGCMLVNGRFFPMEEDFRSHLQETATLHTRFIQHQVYFKKLQDGMNVANYLYDLPSVHRERNDIVFPSEARPLRFVNLVEALRSSSVWVANAFFRNAAAPITDEKTRSVVSLWIVGDLDSDPGIAAVAAALGLMMKSIPDTVVQVSFVHAPNDDSEVERAISKCLATLMSSSVQEKISPKDLLDSLGRLGRHVTDPADEGSRSPDDTSELLLKTPTAKKPDESNIWSGTKKFAKYLGVQGNDDLAILINGRLLLLSGTTRLRKEDLVLLVEYETQQRIKPFIESLEKLDGYNFSSQRSHVPLVMSVIGSVTLASNDRSIMAFSSDVRSVLYRTRHGYHSSYQHGHESEALFDFGVILNPASEAAQRWSALLEVLSHRPDVTMKVWFNPSLELTELPIKRFFRTAISNTLQFEANGRAISPRVEFEGIPTDTLFTLAIDTPPAWLALPHDSVHDLDNIMLSELPPAYTSQGVEAIFRLEHIILAGHAREAPSNLPPRGLQIVLTDLLRKNDVDTIIMANLGYFQFKSAPGLHRLSIRPGRSSELYKLEKTDSSGQNPSNHSETDEADQIISLTTLNGLTIFPWFRKRPEKIDESLIQPLSTTSTSSNKGPAAELTKFIDQVKNLASGMMRASGSDLTETPSAPVINVFTVASGLLYERMAYLMCVSVMKHTRSSVKFWFISNFLSPSFKRFIPHLAREYGFDYQLVTYRWPPWLRAQKEKQRVIWGYKILFLDVLFPLEVDRVIFVDSDQIVRTDLKALVDLDLEGAPYAYAPMCNDRNETKGFRFWDTGYWKDSLQGRPYHISALYVVDLRVFRAIAAGDQLRQHYQALSSDPGSLANLDQDLPNNMQSVLPIHTLDQSWLWCETWCSDEGLQTAKTIDLCNNPLTHEPKLKRARRIIPEWDVYDQEVAPPLPRLKLACSIPSLPSPPVLDPTELFTNK